MPQEKHHIDSCVITEIVVRNPKRRRRKIKGICEQYLYNLAPGYGFISILAYGELHKALLKIENEWERDLSIQNVNYKFKKKEIDFRSPNFEAMKIALELQELDYKLEPADALHIATAIVDGADRFVTLEEKKHLDRVQNYCNEKGLVITFLEVKD